MLSAHLYSLILLCVSHELTSIVFTYIVFCFWICVCFLGCQCVFTYWNLAHFHWPLAISCTGEVWSSSIGGLNPNSAVLPVLCKMRITPSAHVLHRIVMRLYWGNICVNLLNHETSFRISGYFYYHVALSKSNW